MRVRLDIAAVVAGTSAACAARTSVPPQPVVREIETAAVRATAPGPPLRITFDWTATERDARFSGRGAARVEAPYHARLDLFGPRGEGYVTAAVVDGELRLPSDVSANVVPPVPLLWSVLGVFRPPTSARLVATDRDGESTRLVYEQDGGRWEFVLVADRLRSARWDRPDNRRYTVELEGQGPYSLPERAVYRDWSTFTELTLKLDEVERVESFPPEIWNPVGP